MKKKNRLQNPISGKPRPSWLNWQIIGLFFVVLMFVFMMVGNNNLPRVSAESPYAPSIQDSTQPTPTLLPPEYYETKNQTDGIILGGMVLVIIVIAGSMVAMRRDKK